MQLSGIFTGRNLVSCDYPFIESILSVLPLVSEFHINDGGSTDGTLDLLHKLQSQYPETITLHHIPDHQSEMWETIDEQLETLISHCSSPWIIESQADEIWPPDTLRAIQSILPKIDSEGYNSIRQPRINMCTSGTSHIMETIRIVRNHPDLISREGGDSFHLGEYGSPTEGYTNHRVPPEYKTSYPFCHYPYPYHGSTPKMAKRHATHLATESKVRQDSYARHSETHQ